MSISVTSKPGRISVEMSGASALAAMRCRVELPPTTITSVSVRPRRQVRWRRAWLRLPGTHLPGVIRYGSYGVGANREFWAAKRQSEVVVIETDGGPYRRIVLGVDDPYGVAGAITAAIR